MDEKKIKLRIAGITFNQIQSGAYALILAEEGGDYRIPVVIGLAEAQAIAAKLENATLPRPLLHDVFQSMSHAFGVVVKEVFIYRFSKGVFYSEITFSDGEREVKIESRTSDAIALALRCKAPIYTTKELIEETGFRVDSSVDDGEEEREEKTPLMEIGAVPLSRFAVSELEKMLSQSIEKEDYERAAEIKKMIDQKQSNA